MWITMAHKVICWICGREIPDVFNGPSVQTSSGRAASCNKCSKRQKEVEKIGKR